MKESTHRALIKRLESLGVKPDDLSDDNFKLFLNCGFTLVVRDRTKTHRRRVVVAPLNQLGPL